MNAPEPLTGDVVPPDASSREEPTKAPAGRGRAPNTGSSRTRWRRLLCPPQRPSPWWETVVLVVVGSALAFFRLGGVASRGVLWAEDGMFFLSDAHRSGLWGTLLQPYAGYPNVLHRVLAWAVSVLPITWQGVALCLVAALMVGLLATFVHHVVRAHAPLRLAALLSFLAVCCAPVGPDTVVSLTNLQWYLTPAACLAVLWTPVTRPATVAGCLVLAAYVLTSPFGAAPVAISLVVLLITRTRAAAWLSAVGVGSLVMAVAVMVLAPEREGLGAGLDAGLAVRGYLARVSGDGLLGVARHDMLPSLDVTAGLLMLAAMALLAALVHRRMPSDERAERLVVPGVLVLLSIGVWVPLMALTRLDPAPTWDNGRYAVPSALFLLVACALLVEHAMLTPAPPGGLVTAVSRTLAVVVLVCTVYGLVSSYLVADRYARGLVPSWGEEIERARDVCATEQDEWVEIAVAPAGWITVLPCEDVLAE